MTVIMLGEDAALVVRWRYGVARLLAPDPKLDRRNVVELGYFKVSQWFAAGGALAVLPQDHLELHQVRDFLSKTLRRT
jgi:hypothetical protein